jgi:divalent metal cation (Fe/Co/Zn/Cd) transporter
MGDFFQISTSSVSFLLASIGVLVSNVMPVILPLLGLIIGVWIFEAVLTRTRKAMTSSYWNYEKDPFLTEEDKEYYRKTRDEIEDDL